MITVIKQVFYLSTPASSYWLRVTPHGHLEHLYWGPNLRPQDPEALALKRDLSYGGTIAYEDCDQNYSLDAVPLEWSGIGAGDFRTSPIEIESPLGTTVDLRYHSHRVFSGAPASDLPSAHGPCETLEITLTDGPLTALLSYTVFPDSEVICRQTQLFNNGPKTVTVRALASTMVDFQATAMQVMTLDGAWIKESHVASRPTAPGRTQISSRTGTSSNQHNPGIIMHRPGTSETTGTAYGFNLIYSGNHQSTVELNPYGLTRVVQGINPDGFAWPLHPGQSFCTPMGVMAHSSRGFNGLSQAMHSFVRHHIQPARYLDMERPVVFNGWEAMFFDFDQKKQLRLAAHAAKLGMELFVVDDGWFTGRNSDHAGLGDYTVDAKKFPQGLAGFGEKIHDLGMKFGLWFEPEMVNPDSQLYRDHPDWVLSVPGRQPRLGRHQLVLDLCNAQVRDYIEQQVSGVLDSAPIDYVKWDMNRHITDLYSPHVPHQGMTAHRYILGLYEILHRIFDPRPHIILEMCSSGGNRFDLGMLSFAAMIWASDNTDPVERLDIQQGLSYFYPLATISAHVSNSPHQQTLRATPLPTRFNVAFFGALGYEYDLTLLTAQERREVKEQVAFYKKYRSFLHRQDFSRLEGQRPSTRIWQVSSSDQALSGFFQTHAEAAPTPDTLPIINLEEDTYFQVSAKTQRLDLERFGALIHHVMPVRLDPRGTIMRQASKHYAMRDAKESYRGTGALLAQGISLQPQFLGTGTAAGIRLLGDFGSTIYITEKQGGRHG